MPLTPQGVAVNFAGGVDTRTDAKQVVPGKLIDLQNAVFTNNGALSKRNGYSALGRTIDSGGSFTNPVGLAKRGDELVQFANAQAYSYRPGSDTWQTIGPVSSIVANAQPIARTGTTQTAQDAAANGDVTVVAWEDSRGGVWAEVVETTGGRVLMAPVQLDAGGQQPRCVAVGTVIHVMWVNGSAIWIVVLNPSTPTMFTAATVLTNDLVAGSAQYDACPTWDALSLSTQPGLIAWNIAGGYRVGYLHPSGVLGSPGNGLPSVATWSGAPSVSNGPIACAFDKENAHTVAVLFMDATGTGIYQVRFVLPAALDTQNAIYTGGGSGFGATRCVCEYGTKVGGKSTAWIGIERPLGSTDQNNILTQGIDDSGTDISGLRVLRGHCLTSRAFYDNGDVYCAVVHAVLFFPYVAVVQLSSMAALAVAQARVLPGLTAGIPTRSSVPSAYEVHPEQSATGSTSRQHKMALGYRIQLSGTSGTQFGEVGIQLFQFDFDNDDGYRTAEMGRGMYLASALPQHYDGDRFAEADFHCAPDTQSGVITTVTAGGGSMTPSAKYLYKYMYEEIDGQGELHPGPVTPGTLVTMGGDSKVTHTIPTYRLTSKHRVRISVFRSLANATGTIDQIEFFRVSSVDPTAVGNNGYLANNTTVDTVSFVDVMSDAVAQTLEPLYTNGGILSNDPTSFSGVDIVGGKNRLFWIDPLDPNVVRFSQEHRDETAVEMSDVLSIRVDPFGGPIVAIAVIDDNVVVFKETATFVFGGPGPAADGGLLNQNAWTPPQLVTSDVGCKSRSSVANVPQGVVFQSQKGIYLLGRDLQVQRIGDDVFVYNDQRISRATLLPDRPHVVFLTDAGRTLLYDYTPGRERWSTFTNHEGFDAVVVDNVYHYLRTDGRVFVETPGLYRDDNQHIPMLIETAWIKLSGYLQGWQSILWALFLGKYLSEHTLRVRYRINYQEAYTAPIDMNVNSNYNPSLYGAGLYGAGSYGGPGGPSTVYQRGVHLNRDCQSISFRIQDVEATDSYGAAFQLSELLLIGGVLAPDFKVGAART